MKIKDKNNKRYYLRMTLSERIQHFILLSSFFTLVVTGFGLKFPDSFWVKWIISVIGDDAFELRGVVHRVASVFMILVGLYHIIYIFSTKRGRTLFIDMLFKKSDLSDMRTSFKHLLGRTKEHPLYGRFSYEEKMEYWAVFWGTVIMGLTGIVLWFENIFLPIINVAGMDIATIIHYYEAILATLAIIVWHFYFVFLKPDVFPMNKTWLTGYVSREIMEKDHPLELDEIEKDGQDSKESVDEDKESKLNRNEEIVEKFSTESKEDTDKTNDSLIDKNEKEEKKSSTVSEDSPKNNENSNNVLVNINNTNLIQNKEKSRIEDK